MGTGNILIATFCILVMINVPIGMCLGLASIVALAVSQKVPLIVVAQRMFTGLDSFPLLAIPLFMIAGKLMELGGISKRLIKLAYQIVGWLPGGLALISVLACMFFAAISGSAPATVLAIGSVMVPAMVEAGYDKHFAVALLAAAGTIGVIIPPSIPFVTYGITMNVSIGDLFLSGFGPGILMGLALMAYCYWFAKKRGYGQTTRPTLRGFISALGGAIWGLLMPVIILGGIYGGVFTPTEAAAVACVYGLFAGMVIYRELKLRDIPRLLAEAGTTSAMVLLIIGAATAMGWLLTTEQIPVKVANALASMVNSHAMLLLLINIILLITGCFMELNAAIVVLGPIFLPLLLKYKVDLTHFGAIMVLNLALGLLTPPLGVNLFVAAGLEKVNFNEMVKKVMPMLLVLIGVLMLVTYIPAIPLYLVRMLKG